MLLTSHHSGYSVTQNAFIFYSYRPRRRSEETRTLAAWPGLHQHWNNISDQPHLRCISARKWPCTISNVMQRHSAKPRTLSGFYSPRHDKPTKNTNLFIWCLYNAKENVDLFLNCICLVYHWYGKWPRFWRCLCADTNTKCQPDAYNLSLNAKCFMMIYWFYIEYDNHTIIEDKR